MFSLAEIEMEGKNFIFYAFICLPLIIYQIALYVLTLNIRLKNHI